MLGLVCLTALGIVYLSRPSVPVLLHQARLALARNDRRLAETLAQQVLDRESNRDEARLVLGQVKALDRDFPAAVAVLDRVSDNATPAAIEARLLAGRILLSNLHRAAAAEQQFRRVLVYSPASVPAITELVNLLAYESRRREAVPWILELIRQHGETVDHLSLLTSHRARIPQLDWLHACRQAAPDDPGPLLGLAVQALDFHRNDEALELLQHAVRSSPTLLEAQSLRGELLLNYRPAGEFTKWHEALPAVADSDPDIWALRGQWAQRRGDERAAVRCYAETLRRDPNHRTASYQLSQLLVTVGREREAQPFLQRAHELRVLAELINELVGSEQTSLEPVHKVAEQLQKLGRPWEAAAWCRVALQIDAQAAWAHALLEKQEPQLTEPLVQTVETANPVRRLDLSEFPLPDRRLFDPDPGSPAGAQRAPSPISFADSGAEAGLQFRYFNSGRPASEGKRMYEFTGGGVAVLDYDADGSPDLYFTQGCQWPPQPDQRQHLDCLFRNRGDGRFEEVTPAAGLFENGYSQGVAAGDFDGDAFQDLYVANIGANRLFRNNGDGTFSDVSPPVISQRARWTTSCLIADLNADGLPDLYDVTYLGGHDVYDRICPNVDGTPRMCLPFNFPAAQDRLLLNRGDGTFEDVTDTSGIKVPDGKGLGIVAADFFGTGRLSLFIANDTVPNFFFRNNGNDARHVPQFQDVALQNGVALNRDGRAEGSMGIAADDLNGDGRLDLFITNFLNESNTLYLQQEGELFGDFTPQSGLVEPSVPMLGFGTQALDADLDGAPDLVVTNGHIDDLRASGRPYEMPPQFFRNDGKGHFRELPAASLGPFFAGKYLGRGLARLDWNGDGLEDFVVSHLESPAALLTNTTREHGHFLAVRLVGVASCRDAIGTAVTARLADRTLVRQLTAGDGYQASNERQLVFGLGSHTVIDRLTVRWPSGNEQSFDSITADRALLIVEGRDPVEIRR